MGVPVPLPTVQRLTDSSPNGVYDWVFSCLNDRFTLRRKGKCSKKKKKLCLMKGLWYHIIKKHNENYKKHNENSVKNIMPCQSQERTMFWFGHREISFLWGAWCLSRTRSHSFKEQASIEPSAWHHSET